MAGKVSSKRLPEKSEELEVIQENAESEVVLNTDILELIKEMQKKIDLLELEKTEKYNDVSNTPEDEKLHMEDYIKVISLNPNELNLTTERKGRGAIYVFEEFGDVINIPYGDLTSIIRNHRKFLKDGRFAILDSRVIRRHGLDESYSKLLTKENFEAILTGSLSNTSNGNQSDAVKLFENANEIQKENVVRMFVDEIIKNKNKNIDLNFIDRISRIYGENIAQRAEKVKERWKTEDKSNKVT